MRQDAERRSGVRGDAAKTRLDAEHPGERRRNADRPRTIGPDMQMTEVEQGGGGRAAGRAARRAAELPRIACDAGERRMAGADPAEFRQRGLAENYGAGLAQAGD